MEGIICLTSAESIKVLLESCDVNYTNELHLTALHYAAAFNSTAIIQILLDAGADLNSGAKRGETPLLIAQRSNAKDAFELLKSKGGRIEVTLPKTQKLIP